jgi:hypothetical protein
MNRELFGDRQRTPTASSRLGAALRVLGVALALTVLVTAGMRAPHANAMIGVGAVSYCVTTDQSPADAGLRTGLYTVGSDELYEYASGTTDVNGCGVFNYVTAGDIYFISVWSEDQQLVANSSWFETDAMTVAPPISLDTPGYYNRLALH